MVLVIIPIQALKRLSIVIQTQTFLKQHWNAGIGLLIGVPGSYFWRDTLSIKI